MIDPMLLHHTTPGFTLNDDWVLELKYDGVRAILDTTGDGPILYTRRGHVITEQFPEISAPEGLILDGEIVGFDGEFHKLNWVQRRLSVQGRDRILERMRNFPITFVAFDYLNDMSQPLSKRLGGLSGVPITLSPVWEAKEVDKLWRYVKTNNLEGLVAKRLDSIYVPGTRTFNWRKLKHKKPEYRND